MHQSILLSKKLITPLIVTNLLMLGFLLSPLSRWVDIHLANEMAKDTWGSWIHGEDWAVAQPLPTKLNYLWLASGHRPLMVAHALGASSQQEENTLQAMQASISVGIRLLEIDIWLDNSGQLRCHHGPDLPPPLRIGDCRFEDALSKAQAASAWLVLDIKTDFATTGEAVVSRLANDVAAEHVIFQLYKPQDVAIFAGWMKRLSLAGPIITAYVARRSLNHIATHAARLGIQALTVPLYRLSALKRPLSPRLALLVYPVHDCIAAQAAKTADGFYVRSILVSSLSRGCLE